MNDELAETGAVAGTNAGAQVPSVRGEAGEKPAGANEIGPDDGYLEGDIHDEIPKDGAPMG